MTEEQNPTLPEITPQELSAWLKENRANLMVLDVREPYEFPRAKITDERVVFAPLSDLARKGLEGLPEKVKEHKEKADAPLVVLCHHGSRSSQVTAWLMSLGWPNVYNLTGGIDAYARLVDPQIGLY